MHRDYSIHTEGAPVRILMFNDRLEIWNEGGLYGRLTIDGLGKVHADTRNQTLANVLEVMKIAENRYSGIPTIREEMARYGLPEPVFENRRGNFVVTLRNDYPSGSASGVYVTSVPPVREAANILTERLEEESRHYRYDAPYLRPDALREGEFEQTPPPAFRHENSDKGICAGYQSPDDGCRYRVHGPSPKTRCRSVKQLKRVSRFNSGQAEIEYNGRGAPDADPGVAFPAQEQALELIYGHKVPTRESADIVRFCRKQRTRSEIAQFLGRTQYYAMKIFIRPLLAAGSLKMKIPDKPKSRNQRYYSEY
jgi:hypothetical protein